MGNVSIETEIGVNGTVILRNLPFAEGQQVQVLITETRKRAMDEVAKIKNDPLRDQPITYIDPFDPVSEDDWDALS